MGAFAGVAVALIAILTAVRTARAQGVAAGPFLGWSFLVAVAVGAITVAGDYAAFKLCSDKRLQLVLIFVTLVVAMVVGILLARRVWQRLKPPGK